MSTQDKAKRRRERTGKIKEQLAESDSDKSLETEGQRG
jgi:hypothetical protein